MSQRPTMIVNPVLGANPGSSNAAGSVTGGGGAPLFQVPQATNSAVRYRRPILIRKTTPAPSNDSDYQSFDASKAPLRFANGKISVPLQQQQQNSGNSTPESAQSGGLEEDAPQEVERIYHMIPLDHQPDGLTSYIFLHMEGSGTSSSEGKEISVHVDQTDRIRGRIVPPGDDDGITGWYYDEATTIADIIATFHQARPPSPPPENNSASAEPQVQEQQQQESSENIQLVTSAGAAAPAAAAGCDEHGQQIYYLLENAPSSSVVVAADQSHPSPSALSQLLGGIPLTRQEQEPSQ